jgi:hypothetical protein
MPSQLLLLRTHGPWCMSQREGIGDVCPDIIAVPKYPGRRRRKNYLSVKIQSRQTLIAVTPNKMLQTSLRSLRVSVSCERFAGGQRTHAMHASHATHATHATHARTRRTHARDAREARTQRTHARKALTHVRNARVMRC